MVLITICPWMFVSVLTTSFRPLAGIMVLIGHQNLDNRIRVAGVSVPLRGLWFLSVLEGRINGERSPRVSVPLRGLWFLSFAYSKNNRHEKHVSVPLRGLWFLSISLSSTYFIEPFCFRPLAGIMVLILYEKIEYDDRQPRFPSPCGDYGSYLSSLYSATQVPSNMFPSPCGDYGSYLWLHISTSALYRQVSVPLRGLWFLSQPAY